MINRGRTRPKVDDISNQPDWLERATRGAIEVLPFLRHLSILRAWAGTVSVTPDMQPIIDETEVPGLFLAVSAYKGLMTAPAAGRILAELTLEDRRDHRIATFVSLSRFAERALVREPMTSGARLDEANDA